MYTYLFYGSLASQNLPYDVLFLLSALIKPVGFLREKGPLGPMSLTDNRLPADPTKQVRARRLQLHP